jgi:hypothetical protein
MNRAIVAGLLLASAVSAQPGESLKPGQRMPEFELRDQTGRLRNLADIKGPAGAVIVFYRSADW